MAKIKDGTEDLKDAVNEKPNEESSSSSSSSSSEEEEESEEETIDPAKNPLEKTTIQNPAESSSEEESVSDSAIKPSKKINALPNPEKKPMSKRTSSEVDDAKNKKKVKLPNGDANNEKKSVIKRVWSDDDEILLLQGFIDYQSQNGCSPLSDMDGFYQFIMGSLPGNATKSQLYEKIRRLKKKFRVNSEKASSNGVDHVFPKPHERKLFDVSKKIWGIAGCETVNAAANAKSKIKPLKIQVKEEKPLKVNPKIQVKEEDEVMTAKVEDFETLYSYWNAGLNTDCSSSFKFPTGIVALIKENFSLIGDDKAKEMNEKWEAIFENEVVLKRRRIALLSSVNDVETTYLGK